MKLNIEEIAEKFTQIILNHRDGTSQDLDLPEIRFPLPYDLSDEENLIILLAYLPHTAPSFFDELMARVLPEGGDFIEFGGSRGHQFRGFLPTVDSALYLLAGRDTEKRNGYISLFDNDAPLMQVISVEEVRMGEPKTSGRLIMHSDMVYLLQTGEQTRPQFSPDFPAKILRTAMDWSDLVIHPSTADQINDIRLWMNFSTTLLEDHVLRKKIKPGYRALFYGPPGTGKTLTASLLGKNFGKDVYRIDLSLIVSKYIGETEKNLEKIFMRAEHKNWILFFDEADALFGKRSGVQSSHDKYANQEVSYLLQRIEDFSGLIILASNFKNNIDPAFIRRFNNIVHFPMPDANDRLELWKKAMPGNVPFGESVDLKFLADKYELTGAAILNVVQYATLKAIASREMEINFQHLKEGIRKEMQKEDKFMGE